MSAATPATCGVAIDVPDSVVYDEFDESYVDSTFTPAAAISTSLLALEKEARASLASVAATDTTSGYAAGELSVASPSLPAAAMTSDVREALVTADCSVVDAPPPSDIEMTFTP